MVLTQAQKQVAENLAIILY